MTKNIRDLAESASQIIIDADGEIIGRTRIQKIAFILELMDFGSGFEFDYKHYGPFSESLRSALRYGALFDLLEEKERQTNWGGFYSVYSAAVEGNKSEDDVRKQVISLGANADAVELELAATAAFLATEGAHPDPWAETEKRKPEKSIDGRLDRAKLLYRKFLELDKAGKLPAIV